MAAAATPVGPRPDVNSAAIAWFRMLIAVFSTSPGSYNSLQKRIM